MPDEPIWPPTGGGVSLAGDLGGTSAAPQVISVLNGKAPAVISTASHGTSIAVLGARPSTVEFGVGDWFTDIAYVRSGDTAGCAFDIIPRTPADCWIDICDRDLVANGIANYETLNMRKYSGSTASAGRMTIGATAAGTGSTNRDLILQPAGGTVGIGAISTGVDPSAYLEIRHGPGTLGFLPPRSTTTQKNSIASPAEGLIVYDTTLHKLCVRTATAWETITSA